MSSSEVDEKCPTVTTMSNDVIVHYIRGKRVGEVLAHWLLFQRIALNDLYRTTWDADATVT